MTQDATTSAELQEYQDAINDHTTTLLTASEGVGIGVVIPASMNVLLNMFMALKGNTETDLASIMKTLTDVRGMVDFIELALKDEAKPDVAH